MRFRWLEPKLRTAVTNRMFQCAAYRLSQADAVLCLQNGESMRSSSEHVAKESACPDGGERRGGAGEARVDAERATRLEASDEATTIALASDSRLMRAVQAWIDDACKGFEADCERDGGRWSRTAMLREVHERLGSSRFERAIYMRANDDADDEVTWDLSDFDRS